MAREVFDVRYGAGTDGDAFISTTNEAAAQILWGWADGGDGHRLYGRDCAEAGWRWCWRLDGLTILRFCMDLRRQTREPFRFDTKRTEVPFIYELLRKLDAA